MEKSRLEILSEIQETLAGLKARIAEVENRLAELERLPEEPEAPAEAAAEPEPEAAETPVAEVVAEPDTEVIEEFEDLPAEEPAPEEDMSPIDISIDEAEFEEPGLAGPEPAEAPAPSAAVHDAAPEQEPSGSLLDEEDAFIPTASINDRQERRAKKVVMDVVGQKLAWKSAIPGTPVKNVISAISLNDRVLFINTLFKEDPMAFQDAIAAFNAMSSFEEAEEYVRANHPEWNLNSDLVFRLMMAVRRKLK